MSLTLNPNTGTSIDQITITNCTSCGDGSNYSIIWLYNNTGTLLGADFFIDVNGQTPLPLSDGGFNSNTVDGKPTIYSNTPLNSGTYNLAVTPYSGGANNTACETDFTTCTNKQYASFTISAGGGTTTSTTTSTTEQLLGSVNFGLAIIIFLISIVFTAYIFNTYNMRRKPWQK